MKLKDVQSNFKENQKEVISLKKEISEKLENWQQIKNVKNSTDQEILKLQLLC